MGNVPNIVLTRVDNRLIHGQVATNWLKTYNANLCIVADDAVAEDSMQQTLLKLAAGNMQIRFFTIQKTIDIIYKASPSQKIAIICLLQPSISAICMMMKARKNYRELYMQMQKKLQQ